VPARFEDPRIVIIGSVVYYRYDRNAKSMAVLRMVHGAYDMSSIRGFEPGYIDGPDGLLNKIVVTETQLQAIGKYGGYKTEGGLIYDNWRNPVYVIRTSKGYMVCSRGRDGEKNTEDDLFVE
jgi:hypothetical protein